MRTYASLFIRNRDAFALGAGNWYVIYQDEDEVEWYVFTEVPSKQEARLIALAMNESQTN